MSVKIGDLVRRYTSAHLGIVIEVLDRYVKVCWSDDYGTFWASTKAVEIVSKGDNKPLTHASSSATI
jgi:hypothetical protein